MECILCILTWHAKSALLTVVWWSPNMNMCVMRSGEIGATTRRKCGEFGNGTSIPYRFNGRLIMWLFCLVNSIFTKQYVPSNTLVRHLSRVSIKMHPIATGSSGGSWLRRFTYSETKLGNQFQLGTSTVLNTLYSTDECSWKQSECLANKRAVY